jgi:hypothetical protein
METHQRQIAGLDVGTRELTRRLADLAKMDGDGFAAVVRAADVAQAAGKPRDGALRAALDAACAVDMPSRPDRDATIRA